MKFVVFSFQNGGISQRPEVYQSVLEMWYRFLRWRPVLVLGCTALPAVVELALSVVENEERESSRSALHFLDILFSPGPKSPASITSQK